MSTRLVVTSQSFTKHGARGGAGLQSHIRIHLDFHFNPNLSTKPGEAAARTRFLPGPSASHSAALFMDVGTACMT